MKKIYMNSVDLWFWIDFDFGMFFFGLFKAINRSTTVPKVFYKSFWYIYKKGFKNGFLSKKNLNSDFPATTMVKI
jgi:hypothetical protein